MSKYESVNENIGELFVAELFASIEDESITGNELFRRKLVNKFKEAYEFGLTEAVCELQEAMDAINSLKTN